MELTTSATSMSEGMYSSVSQNFFFENMYMDGYIR